METTGKITWRDFRLTRATWTFSAGVACALLVALSLTGRMYAADGDLDIPFGSGGRVITDFAGLADQAKALAVDGNGRIVAAGFASDNWHVSFAVARYHADGTLDTTFGSGGKVTTNFFAGSGASAVAIDAHGRIVAAGTAWMPVRSSDGTIVSYSQDFALARYTQDGSLDTSFGPNGDGTVTTDLPGHVNDELSGIVIDAAGKLVVAGTPLGNADIALVRFNEDGTLDSSFGDAGIVTTSVGEVSYGYALTLDANGKIVVAGTARNALNNWDVVLTRYHGDGSLDSSFGSGGVVTSDLGGSEFARGVAIDSDSRIVVAGNFEDSFLVARYTANGVLDTGFNGSGHVTTDVGGLGLNAVNDLVIDANRRIMAVGYTWALAGSNAAMHFALARYLEDGTPDAGFGSGGKLTTAFPGYAVGFAAALDADDNVVVAGVSFDGTVDDRSTNDFALARYVNGTSGYTFSGFFAPVDNAPARNVVKAGRAVPVKFSLNGYQGLDILAAGSPASQQIACEAGARLDVLEETLTATRSSLTYDAVMDQYIYVWKTEKAWANTCRQLVVTLTDGTSHVANFQLSN
jgi:uncharacterized delta-60 repeat protein